MSDRETVTIDSGQFNGLSQKLDNLAARLGPSDEQYSLHQVLTHLETTLNRLATTMGGGDNSQVLTAIKSLGDKVDALALSIKEDNNAQIRALADEVKSVREKLQTSVDNQTKGD